MRPAECPECGEMIEPAGLNCYSCGKFIEPDPDEIWQTIQSPNGNDVTIYGDGSVEVKSSDGRRVWIDDDGLTKVELADRQIVWVELHGRTQVGFPDRDVIINPDGTTSTFMS